MLEEAAVVCTGPRDYPSTVDAVQVPLSEFELRRAWQWEPLGCFVSSGNN